MSRVSTLVLLAGVLVLVTAAVHLAIGVIGLYESLIRGTGSAGMPLLYLFAAIAAYALVGAYAFGRIEPASAYALGLGLMVFYIVAYADWHVFGFAESTLPLDAAGLGHDHATHDHGHGHDHTHDHDHSHDHGDGHSHGDEDSSLSLLIDHLRDDPFALVSKTAELGAAATLAVLYGRERTE